MAIKKRGTTYHTDFAVDGERFRQSLETSDWREAQRLERELIGEARAGKLAATKDDFSRLAFAKAAERFLADRIGHLAPRSIQTERERVKPINKVLGDVVVWRMTPAQVVGYIRDRKAAGRSNATVNRELDIIRGVLKRAKRWYHFADDIHPLPVRQNIGRALTYEEKVKLLHRAGTRPEWQTVASAARLALNTTMRGCEIKEMRWREVDMIERTLTVRKSKTEAGERVIPLNQDAWEVIVELYRRNKALGATEPSHFLFPACETAYFDPTRGIKSWRTAWRRLTRAVQCGGCGLLQRSAWDVRRVSLA
jgi:integrase